MSYQEIIIESGYSCDWQQKCSQFEDTLKSKKHPVLVFSQNEKTMISGDFPSKKTLEKFYFYFFRFMNLLKKSSSYGVVIQRNIEDFEIPVVIQSNSV